MALDAQAAAADKTSELQWVRRPRTPVMLFISEYHGWKLEASMGPASENAGYVWEYIDQFTLVSNASMGPASENAGYDA